MIPRIPALYLRATGALVLGAAAVLAGCGSSQPAMSPGSSQMAGPGGAGGSGGVGGSGIGGRGGGGAAGADAARGADAEPGSGGVRPGMEAYQHHDDGAARESQLKSLYGEA